MLENFLPVKLEKYHRILSKLESTSAMRQKRNSQFVLSSSTTGWQVCLAGLTLLLDPSKRETSLKQSHGLQVCDWGQELSNGLTGIGSLRTRLTKGLFHDLLVATDNKFYFRSNSSVVNWFIGANIPALGSECMLEEIVARIPDVSNQYNVWTDKCIPFMVLESLEVDRVNDLIRFTVAAKDESVDSVFPIDGFPNRSVTEDGSAFIVECRSTDIPFFAQQVGIWDIGDVVLYGPLKSNLYFTPLAACFILSFTLGMLCRYFPTIWVNMDDPKRATRSIRLP